jgi:hypothetical protein
MIEKRTVLVLGAGASKPYGFPTGEELLKEIVYVEQDSATPVGNALQQCGFRDLHIREFVYEMNRSGRKSVDAFLEHRAEFEIIGKTAMIAALVPKENPPKLFDRSNDEHWYQYLFQQMGSSFEEFCNSRLSVITYNYDRSLESLLLNALESYFKKKRDECIAVLNKMPIIHLHGQLGTLLTDVNDGTHRRYENRVDPLFFERCIPQIKIVHEVNDKDNPEFKRANQLLVNAERICFLGFGYDKINLRRLAGRHGTPQSFLTSPFEKQGCGTAQGFTKAEIKLIIQTQLTGNFFCGRSILGQSGTPTGDRHIALRVFF